MTSLFAFLPLWGTLLVGVGALAIPILIHLFNRKRYRVVVWAAMRFLLAAQKQNTRRMRIEQLILLMVRCLLLLLLVAALASITPWAEAFWASLKGDGNSQTKLRIGRIHKVIVLDASLSMTAKLDDGRTCFDKARELALRIVSDADNGDGFSVLVLKETPEWVVTEASLDRGRVSREINEIKVTHGNTSALTALRVVANHLNEKDPRFTAQQVYFLTDQQRATWGVTMPSDGQGQPPNAPKGEPLLEALKKDANLIFVDVGRDHLPNVAVTQLTVSEPILTTNTLVAFQATIRNYGAEAQTNMAVELKIGRGRSAAGSPDFEPIRHGVPKKVSLRANEETLVSFTHRFTSPGIYAVQVSVNPDDDRLDVDNIRTVIVTVRERIPLLLVNGQLADPNKGRLDDAIGELPLIFDPPLDKDSIRGPVKVTTRTVHQFANPKEVDLADFDCVFLCDVATLTPQDVNRLEAHLRRGGGVIITAGDNVADNLDVYNKLLYQQNKGLLPVALKGVQEAPANNHFYLDAEESHFQQPPLRPFLDSSYRKAMQNAQFYKYLRVGPLAGGNQILVFRPEGPVRANLPSGDPAILEWNPPLPAAELKGKDPGKTGGMFRPTRFRGKVILVTTTINPDWTGRVNAGNPGWHISSSFLPLMEQLWRLAVSAKVRDQAVLVGQPLEEVVGAGESQLKAQVFPPGWKKAEGLEAPTQSGDGFTLFRWTDTEQAGVYRVTLGKEPTDYLFAVNPPPRTDDNDSESDLSRLDEKRLSELFSGWNYQRVVHPKDARPPQNVFSESQEVWPVRYGPPIAFGLLLAVLALMLLEVVLACVFAHFSVVPGVKQIPRLRLLWPTVTATLALVAVVAVAGTFVQAAANNNDVLSFLPESARAMVEGFSGIQPPGPGESPLWELQSSPDSSMPSGMWIGLGLLGLLVVGVVYVLEARAVGYPVAALLGLTCLSLFLIVLILFLPQWEVQFVRQSWPDLVLILDDSLSMGEPDYYNETVQAKVDEYAADIRKQLEEQLPGRITATQTRLEALKRQGGKAADALIQEEERRLDYYEKLLPQLKSPSWRPTRLQLAQHLLTRANPDWLNTLFLERKLKVHVFHLDGEGKLTRLKDAEGFAGDLIDAGKPETVERTRRAIQNLIPAGKESHLGDALQQVLSRYAGTPVAGVVFFTDGVTTGGGKKLADLADFAKTKNVPLFFVGIGDDHEVRDLKLHDLQVEDTVYVNDRVIFEAKLTGRGYKGMTLPIVLKVKDKNGKEIEVAREKYVVEPNGQKVRLAHQPTEPGEKVYILEAELPKLGPNDKGPNPAHLRLQKSVYVQEAKLIKVLYIEGSARYEYRFLKNLLERENQDKQKNRNIDLKVLLLDADTNFTKQDKSAIGDFPVNKQELFEYDLVILGDVDPSHPKLREGRLRMLADFVQERGGGLLMVAGSLYSPHAFKKTALATVLPIDIGTAPPEKDGDKNIETGYHLRLIDRMHPIFRFSQDPAANERIWKQLQPLYWAARGYSAARNALVLAVHPKMKAEGPVVRGVTGSHPLIVEHFPGAGRCMFFGFDESWRWRFRQDELRYNQFWIATVRYLARSRVSRTEVRTEQQTPYQPGKAIKVFVRFPESLKLKGSKAGRPLPEEVRVTVQPLGGDAPGGNVVDDIKLGKVGKNGRSYEGLLLNLKPGKYRLTLGDDTDVTDSQPNGQQPFTEVEVENPPTELMDLRLNREEMELAAGKTGKVYTPADADDLLRELPPVTRMVSRISKMPPQPIWNHWAFFFVVVGLLTGLWILRKREHLL